MTLRVVGAGLGRTGTASLKQALEVLLGGPCYHMLEVANRPRDVVVWESAVRGEQSGLSSLLDGFEAAVDWPACAFWKELAAANPEAVIVLSTRDSAASWWASMEGTIVPTLKSPVSRDKPALARQRAMVRELLERRFTAAWDEPVQAMAAYERHNEEVLRAADPSRLVQWRPGDGWEPICAALEVAVPDVPFPFENTTAAFRARQGLR